MKNTPDVISNPREMIARSREIRARGEIIGFVPTMGALHAGHTSLIDYARHRCDKLVVSIFVNPLQFDRPDDLRAYPRTFENDLATCASHGVDIVYHPGVEEMYPDGFQTRVVVDGLTRGLCGAFRPGHFEGVTTVVMKLFNAVAPHFAVFGEKDYQQLQVIKRMVADLDMDIEIVGRPTVREPDGLAMSSRNAHLSEGQRYQALCLWRAIDTARKLVARGERFVPRLKAAAAGEIERTEGARLEYLEIIHPETLEPLTQELVPGARIALAVWVGTTRLIDNAPLEGEL